MSALSVPEPPELGDPGLLAGHTREQAEVIYAEYRQRLRGRGVLDPLRPEWKPLAEWLSHRESYDALCHEVIQAAVRKLASRHADQTLDAAEKDEQARRNPVVVKSGAWLNGQEYDPLAWVIPGIMPEGLTLLSARPKCGKSYLMLAVGLSVASGSQILGCLPGGQPRPVLYMALEDSDRRLKSRAAKVGWEKLPGNFWYVTRASPDQTLETIYKFITRHAGQRPLVMVDTLGKLLGPARKGETTYDRDYRVGIELGAAVAETPGSSVWASHHDRKQGGEHAIDRVSGTYGTTASVDTILCMARKDGEAEATLFVQSRELDEEHTYRLGGQPWELAGGDLGAAEAAARAAAERERLGERSAQILDLVTEKGHVTTAEVAEALGISSESASAYLGRLYKSSKIDKDGRGSWRSLVSTVGSVRSVGNTQHSQHTQHGMQESPPEPDWQRLSDLGNPGAG